MKNAIRESRKELKMSQETLAKEASISRATISMLENNKGVVLKTSTMEKIADALKKTVREIFFD
jgi:DNA-binding XRE family transcriptional regulator